jgi:hypothetical protein
MKNFVLITEAKLFLLSTDSFNSLVSSEHGKFITQENVKGNKVYILHKFLERFIKRYFKRGNIKP